MKIFNNKKGDFKLIATILVILFVMILTIFIVSTKMIKSSNGVDFCQDSVDWDDDGIPDRIDTCVCQEKETCDSDDKKAIAACMTERNNKLCS